MSGVLVVDDDDDIREALAETLLSQGYQVRTAADGRQALDMLRREHLHPCVVLLDMMMPNLSGTEVASRIAADPELADLPVVFFSAAGPGRFPSGARVLHKPTTIETLLSVVDEFCHGPCHHADTNHDAEPPQVQVEASPP